MTNDEIMNLAKAYLTEREIPFVEPGEFGVKKDAKQEVIFLEPRMLLPDTFIIPEDIRLWVNTETKEVTLIFQM